MERFLNIIHYKLFVWFIFIHRITNYINPIWWFVGIPFVKRFHKKKGIDDFRKLMDEEVFNHKIYGFNITYAGITIGGLLVLIMFSLFNLIQVVIQKPLINIFWQNFFFRILFVISLGIIPWKICNNFIFNDDKYLKYFQEFEKQSKNWKRNWAYITISVVIGILLFFAFTLFIFIHSCPIKK